jgi:DNA polymerase-1
MIFQVFHAIPAMTGPKGMPTNAVFGFTGDLLRLRRRNPDYLVCVFDAPGKTFRDDMYPEYKAHRAPMPDDLQLQIPLIQRLVQAMRLPIVQVPGVEADDAIATIARQAEERGIDVFICSADKDLRQMLTDRVKIYNLRKDTILDREGLRADWGVSPEQVIDMLALTGDSVDNVPGVPGIGIKTAQKLLQEYQSIDGIVAKLETMKAGKVRDNLRTHATTLEMSRNLVRLKCDVDLSCDWDAWKLQPWDSEALLELFQECGFHRYAREVREESPEPNKPATDGQLFGDLLSKEAEPETKQGAKPWEANYQLIDTPTKFSTFLQELCKQKRFAIDTETTSIDPTRADIVGIAICWKAGEAYYLAVRGPAGQPTLDPEHVVKKLKPILEDPAIAKINQNIKYDYLVFRRVGIVMNGIAGDSMIASYLLTSGERNHNLDELSTRYLEHQPIPITDLIGKGKNQRRMDEVDTAQVCHYSAEDADVAWRLCDILEPQLQANGLDVLYRDLELPLVAVLADLEYTGIKVDVPFLRRLSTEFAEQLTALEKSIYELAGHSFNIDSPKQLRQVLFDELKLPASRKTAITGEASTGQDVLEELAAGGHELPRKITDYRQVAKLKGTYVDALPSLVNPLTGRIHASFNQTVASTGRLSSSDPNLQNIPVRTELGRQIRQAFIPGEPRWVLLTADYSQIELRILAHFSQDQALQEAFAADRDIHAFVAAQIYGVAEGQVTDAQRRNAKTVNFGVIYGLSAFGLAKRLGISQQEAETFIDAYFARYPGVAKFQEQLLAETRKTGYVTTMLGRRRAIQGIRATSTYRQRNQPEREALNAVIQGSAADMIKKAMLNLHRRLQREQSPARMLLQIHDELVFETRKENVKELAAVVEKEMTTALPLAVPVTVDVAAGGNWLDVEGMHL